MRLNKFIISDSIRRFFSLNKALCFFILTIISFGIVTGIFCVIKSNNSINIQTMPFFLLKNILTGNKSFIFYFFTKLLLIFFIFLICFFLSFLKVGPFLTISVIFYISYLLGISCAILYYCMRLSLLLSIVIVPYEILLLFLLGVCVFRFLKFNRQLSKYGNCYTRGKEFKILVFSFLICTIIILFETISLALLFKICVII